jgi:hypothetical protein
MAILQLSFAQLQTGRYTLTEHGERYHQLSQFRSVAEVSKQLSHLGLLAWQVNDLWDGKEVELDSEHSWPNCP